MQPSAHSQHRAASSQGPLANLLRRCRLAMRTAASGHTLPFDSRRTSDRSHGHVPSQRSGLPLVRIQGLSPFPWPDGVLHQIKLTYGRRLLRLHQHPAFGGRAREVGTILSVGCRSQTAISGRPPVQDRSGSRADAIRSLLAPPSSRFPRWWRQRWCTATGRRRACVPGRRWSSCVSARQGAGRSWNHRLSGEVGWFATTGQANSTIVVPSGGLPALHTPCSWSIEPLCLFCVTVPATQRSRQVQCG